MKKRLPYLIIFVLLFAVEVLIALFVHDDFVRPYLGDVIVVWVVYCFVQIILGKRFNSYAVCVGVFLFACLVEFLQGIKIVEILGLENSSFFRTLIGTSFAIEDLLCYAAGSVITITVIFISRHIYKKEMD